jgi:hypothetical protein
MWQHCVQRRGAALQGSLSGGAAVQLCGVTCATVQLCGVTCATVQLCGWKVRCRAAVAVLCCSAYVCRLRSAKDRQAD